MLSIMWNCFTFFLLVVPAVLGRVLYPFGSAAGDVAVAKQDDVCNYVYNHNISMFGIPFTRIYVCTNGMISLDQEYRSFTPEAFPLQSSNKAPLICPFWADIDIRNGGDVWSRESVDPALLQRTSLEVKDAFSTDSAYNATWSLIVTWDAVRAYGGSNTLTSVNTFQAVLVSDGNTTFAIFNYEDINWTHGSSSSIPAQVGFDSGDGTHYYATADSQKPGIADIEKKSNIGIPGKMMFKLGSANATASQDIQIPDKPSPAPNSTLSMYNTTTRLSTTLLLVKVDLPEEPVKVDHITAVVVACFVATVALLAAITTATFFIKCRNRKVKSNDIKERRFLSL